jgi:hypothetical protein
LHDNPHYVFINSLDKRIVIKNSLPLTLPYHLRNYSALAQVSRPVRERYFTTLLLVCRRNILQLINIKQEISKDSAAALLI